MANLPLSEDSCSSGMNPSDKFMMFFDLHNYTNRKKSFTGSKRLRTPRSLTRLMQQHRDGERHRHRGLNASIEEICKHVPGYDENGCYTKIGKLTMITNYICHLEEYIQELCEEVGLDLDFKNLFLSPHIKELDTNDIYHSMHSNHDVEISNKSSMSEKRIWQENTELQNLECLTTSPSNSSNSLPEYVFPGTGCYDPFSICDEKRISRTETENTGQLGVGVVPQTPKIKNKAGWPNEERNDHFLSPEIFSFLLTDDYNVGGFELPSPDIKMKPACSQAVNVCHTVGSPCYTKCLEIVPDDAIPVLFDTEVITEMESSKKRSGNDLKPSEANEFGKEQTEGDTKTGLHLVPHLEGMDMSEEEEEEEEESEDKKGHILLCHELELLTDQSQIKQSASNQALPNITENLRVDMMRDKEPSDEMFMSCLQQIEEDDNDYSLCEKSSELLASPSDCADKSFQQCSSENTPLLTPSQLLMDAGLSPQYMKAGCPSLVYSPACSVPMFKRFGRSLLSVNEPSHKVEPAMTSVSESFGCHILSTDSSHSVDKGVDLSPQLFLKTEQTRSRNSTPVDSDYDSLANEPISGVTSRGAPEKLLNGSMASSDSRTFKPGMAKYNDCAVDVLSKDQNTSNVISGEVTNSPKRPHIDYRKVSWMNGFMMFSCLNRKTLSMKNPGLHASQITKLLGQEWRNMSAEQQSSYRNQAAKYVKEILSKTLAAEQ